VAATIVAREVIAILRVASEFGGGDGAYAETVQGANSLLSMKKSLLPFLFLLELAAQSVRGQAVSKQPPKPGEKPVISRFVLYAERNIKLGDRIHVKHGDIGVRSALALKEGVQLSVGKHDRCRNLFAPSISIEHDAEVHDVATNSLKKDPDSEVGAESAFPADMPPLPLAAASGAGADVTVEHHHHRSLTPGTYGEVRLGPRSELTLAAGKYTFASLKMDERSKLRGDRGRRDAAERGGVDVHIIGGLWMGEHAEIGPRNDDAKANELTIEVAGADPGISGNDDGLGPRHAVTIGNEANKVHALLAAPHGTVRMAHEARLKGAIAGFDIVADEKVHAEFESGFPVSPPDGQGSQPLHGYFGPPPDPTVAALVGPVPPSTVVNLSIGLPARDPAGLRTFVNQVSDPHHPSYRHYLTQAQFTATYGRSFAQQGAGRRVRVFSA
jgi:Pro-kumamolisin, activation domain